MNFLRALVVSCLITAVPTTALAGAVDRGHCKMKGAPAQASSIEVDHSMHAGHVMDGDDSARQAAEAANGCECGCDCSSNHCASSFSGFLTAELGGNLAGRFADRHALPVTVARVSAAHHLDLIRPPAQA